MVVRHGDVWDTFVSMENLRLGFNDAIRGRHRNKQVQKILSKQKYDIIGKKRKGETREQYLIRKEKRITRFLRHLQFMLNTGQYKTSKYETRDIRDPKPRTLYILPLYPDRIVQQALVRRLKPIWDKQFIYQSYACRKGKGQHKCSLKMSECVAKYKYCGLTDISKFYPSIPHDELFSIVQRKIKDKKILALLKDIIYSIGGEKNVPIGNLTSQWLGNLYLNELDQYVAHVLKISDAPRYMDDKAYFSNDKKELRKSLELIETFISEKLKLKLSRKTVLRCDKGVPFIGYRHFPGYVLLRKRTTKRIKRRIPTTQKRYKKKQITLVQYTSTLASYYGWASFGNTYNFRKSTRLDVLLESARNKIKEVKMRGFPKYTDIATKYDVNNLRDIFPKETKQFLECLKGDRFIWEDKGDIPSIEDGIVDDTHKVVEVLIQPTCEGEEPTKELHQLELIEDKNARVFRMGYTLNEIDSIIEELSSLS